MLCHGVKAHTYKAIHDHAIVFLIGRLLVWDTRMYTFDPDRQYNQRYNRPIVPPIHIKPIHSSVSYQQAICQNMIGVDAHRLVDMTL